MNDKVQITKPIADIIVKVCFDTVEFARLYEQDKPNSAKKILESSSGIKSGMNGLIGAETSQIMIKNIADYKNVVRNTLDVYNNLNLLLTNKVELINTLIDLQQHLTELQQEINKTLKS